MIIKDICKEIGSSSYGLSILHLKRCNKVLVLDVDKCRLIEGVEGYLDCWLSNNLRVYTDCEIHLYNNTAMVSLPNESIKFVCNTLYELPDFMKDNNLTKEGLVNIDYIGEMKGGLN